MSELDKKFEKDLQEYQENMRKIFTDFQQKQVELFNKFYENGKD